MNNNIVKEEAIKGKKKTISMYINLIYIHTPQIYRLIKILFTSLMQLFYYFPLRF